MIVLGVDPGKLNTALALVRLDRGYPPIYMASTPLPMYEDRVLADRVPAWRDDLECLLRALRPQLVCAERYVPRPGMSRGAPAEVVNLFLGVLCSVCLTQHLSYLLVMPSTHKRYYETTWGEWLIDLMPTPHQADAVSLAIYGCHWLHK